MTLMTLKSRGGRLCVVCGSPLAYYPAGHPSAKLVAALLGRDAQIVTDAALPLAHCVLSATHQDITLKIFNRYDNLTRFGAPIIQSLWRNGFVQPAATSVLICLSAYDQLACFRECKIWLQTLEALVVDLVDKPDLAAPLGAADRQTPDAAEKPPGHVYLGLRICVAVDQVTDEAANLMQCIRSLAAKGKLVPHAKYFAAAGASVMALDLSNPGHANFTQLKRFIATDDKLHACAEPLSHLVVVGGADSAAQEVEVDEEHLPTCPNPDTCVQELDSNDSIVGLQSCLRAIAGGA